MGFRVYYYWFSFGGFPAMCRQPTESLALRAITSDHLPKLCRFLLKYSGKSTILVDSHSCLPDPLGPIRSASFYR